MSSSSIINRLTPKSLLNRMLLLMLLGISLAQGISTLFWSYQIRLSNSQEQIARSRDIAAKLTSMLQLIDKLPVSSQDQLLNQKYFFESNHFYLMKGASHLAFVPVVSNSSQQQSLGIIQQAFKQNLPSFGTASIELVAAEQLFAYPQLSALAEQHKEIRPKDKDDNELLFVTQAQLSNQGWVYLIAPLPKTSEQSNKGLPYQVLNLILMAGFLLPFTYWAVRWQTRPLHRLATAAAHLALNIYQPAMKEEGSSELARTTRAFNAMQEKLKRYIDDRERLFRSISHDLKTPITRLRLRTELLDDESIAASFHQDLDDLEIMTKGALQTVRDTDIHENIQDINILNLINLICESHEGRVDVRGRPHRPYRGKPLAIKRCLSNLIENAIKYGDYLTISIVDQQETLVLYFDDEGPGIPVESQEEIFSPYVRLNNSVSGTGLGLGIARNIAHAHGGEVELMNLPKQGLQVKLLLPHIK